MSMLLLGGGVRWGLSDFSITGGINTIEQCTEIYREEFVGWGSPGGVGAIAYVNISSMRGVFCPSVC